MKRYFCIISGRVQGVGFRGFTQMLAMQTGVTGRVRNMSNGMVELQIQGEEEDLDNYLVQMKKGNRFVKISNVSVKEIDVVPNEKRFTPVYDDYSF